MNGLSSQQVPLLQQQYGKNEISSTESFSALKLFLQQFPTIINAILAVGGIFSFVIHESLDGFFIFAILILNALLGFFQEFRAEKALEKLKQISQPICIALRDGKAIQLPAAELVPDDMVILNEGDRIPADGTITTETHLEVDESILTGESLAVVKEHTDEVFQGTFVAKGKGQMKVIKIGMQTKLGQISQTLSSVEEDATPLQKQITQLARILSFGAMGIAILLVPIGIAYGKALYPILLLAISIGVAAIPESLPAVITISLALGTNRMAQKKAIVRKLASIETVGAVQVVLTDKTGTLTQNDMRVKEYYVQDAKLLHPLIHACVVGNTAHIVEKPARNASHSDAGGEIIGDKTDGALLLWANEQEKTSHSRAPSRSEKYSWGEGENLSKDGSSTKSRMTDEDVTILDEFTFDPLSKTITTVAKMHDKPFVVVRGAPESVLGECKLTQKDTTTLTKKYESFASQGFRVIALAQKHEPNHKKLSRKELETNLEFLGFMCIYDPPRVEARQAVLDAQKAGIRVVMVTGDNPLTAKAIATDVGILDGNTTVMTGKDLDGMDEKELQQTITDVSVYARTTPEHKMRLVNAFQKIGVIVGVTGDGVNDALALKKANVGLSMGQKGTDVAKEASDIVLADDNFATLVEAVKEGRKIYANIVKAITYLLAGNIAELGLIFFATCFNTQIPLLPTQILWINLVTDGLPALALASDTSTFSQIHSKPRNPEEPIITKSRMIFILSCSFILTLICLTTFISLDNVIGIEKARTVVFNLMIGLQMILAFIVRGRQSIFSNKFFLITMILTVIFQILLTTHPILQQIFHLSI